MSSYTRQSSFSNGDIIDAPAHNAEYDQLVAAFAEDTGHSHDGAAGEGAYVPLVSSEDNLVSVRVDDTVPGSSKIIFKIDGSDVITWTEGDTEFFNTTALQHKAGNLDVYLDGLEIAVGDAASDAAAAAASALAAEEAAMVVGVPVIVADAGSYVISETAEIADVIFLGDGTLTLPTTLVVGRRFYVHLHLSAVGKLVNIPTGAHTITGNIGTVPPSNTFQLIEGDVIVLEVVSTTELEVL